MSRPFQTDYAGWFPGRCKSRESAVQAAVKHIVTDGYSRCTITDTRSGEVVARVRLSTNRCRAVVEVPQPFTKIGV